MGQICAKTPHRFRRASQQVCYAMLRNTASKMTLPGQWDLRSEEI